MRTFLFLSFLICSCLAAFAQEGSMVIKVSGEQNAPLDNATVEVLKNKNTLVKVGMTDTAGTVSFSRLAVGDYTFRISRVGYVTFISSVQNISGNSSVSTSFTLQPANGAMQNVTVTARKPFIEMKPDKTIVNLDAAVSTVGSTALEALEKLPGVTVDKDGNISLKGKNGVLVLIDGKQTYLDPAQLANMLGGMNAAQLNTVEIMSQPSAKYDATGNAGIINITTKKNRQKGFNGSFNAAYSQGFYPRYNNSLQLNYRSGKFNYFLNYSNAIFEYYTKVEALRTYYEKDNQTIALLLDQPSFLYGNAQNNTLRGGVDYFINQKTTVGIAVNGTLMRRNGKGNNTAFWMGPDRVIDSQIVTHSNTGTRFKNGGGNINFRHQFSDKRELSADVDVLGYRINGNQYFENILVFPGTYTEASRAVIPTDINIVSAKTDYAQQLQKTRLETGYKTSHITTDNLADYEYLDGNTWKQDVGKTNHFLYTENINALYVNAQRAAGKLSLQGGLRYEMTAYDARQLGNTQRKDSSFSRAYNSLFPTFFASYNADSSNTFTLSAGRRIDRPVFQKLNPFLFIINKYTYSRGNPFYRPQYTWNFELNHQYKEWLTTGVSYSIINDYMMQIFPLDTATGIVIYTEGNLGRLRNMGASMGVQLKPLKWWNMGAQANVNNKKMAGNLGKFYERSITQFTLSMNNQFKWHGGWAGELSGVYTSRSQVDILEVLDPAGQLTVGVSKNVLKNKGTVKFSMRDVFHTQWTKGNTFFEGAHEKFLVSRDSRVATISFTYRFGKAIKATKRSSGAAGEEMQRVSNG